MKFLEIKLNEENKKNYIKIVNQNINNQITTYQITSIPLVGELITKHNKNQQTNNKNNETRHKHN